MTIKPKNKPTSRKASETLRPEYHFDYTKARPNRLAGRDVSKSIVLLDPDVAKVFKRAESVKLRAILAAAPTKLKHRPK